LEARSPLVISTAGSDVGVGVNVAVGTAVGVEVGGRVGVGDADVGRHPASARAQIKSNERKG